jgi:hypothetical protein
MLNQMLVVIHPGRFCLRNIGSIAATDTITECFTVNNSNVSCTGTLFIRQNESYRDIRLGSTDGNHLSIATTAGQTIKYHFLFSTATRTGSEGWSLIFKLVYLDRS